jgi:hypothetical protein
LVMQKSLEQPADQESRPFLRISRHEKSAFERSCPTFSSLKPIAFVERIGRLVNFKPTFRSFEEQKIIKAKILS